MRQDMVDGEGIAREAEVPSQEETSQCLNVTYVVKHKTLYLILLLATPSYIRFCSSLLCSLRLN